MTASLRAGASSATGTAAVVTTVVLLALLAMFAAQPANAAEPEWFPLRGNHEIGCTQNNPSPAGGDNCSGYHSWAALDIDATRSDNVYAAGGGTVHSFINNQPQNCPAGQCNGNRVIIAHPVAGGTVYSVYLHLSSVAGLSVGQAVDQNTVLGRAGDSGYSSTGYVHLHFEVRTSPLVSATGYRNGLPLKACVDGQLRTYPGGAGYGSWAQMPRNTVLRSDGTNCGAPPPPPPPPPPKDDICLVADAAPTGTGREELHCASAASGFQQFGVQTALPWEFQDRARAQHLLGDIDADGRNDACLLIDHAPTGSGREELHCVSAASGYQQHVVHAALPWEPQGRGRVQEMLADADGDRRDDLCLIADAAPTGSGRSELHCVSAASGFQHFFVHAALPWGFQDRAVFRLLMGDVDGDGRDDACTLIDNAPVTGSGREELHCASASSGYRQHNAHFALPWTRHGRDRSHEALADIDGDGRDDACLIIDGAPTGTGREELHCASSSSGYQQHNAQVGLPWPFQDRSRFIHLLPGRAQEVPLPAAAPVPVTTAPPTGAPAGTTPSTPTGVTRTPVCRVPRLVGRTVNDARRAIARSGCRIGRIAYTGRANRRVDRVATSSRKAGRTLAAGTRINLVIRR